MDRRQFLVLSAGLLAVGCAVPPPDPPVVEATPPTLRERIEAHRSAIEGYFGDADLAVVTEVGREVLLGLEDSDEAVTALFEPVLDGLDEGASVPDRVRRDFLEDRVRVVAGWSLGSTESALAGMLAY